jgi:tetratricopeptide (TPR) repeat protein
MARASLQRPDSLDVYGLLWRGVELRRRYTPSDNAKGRELLEKVVALDPNYAAAYTHLAWTHFQDWQNGWLPGKPRESYQKGLDLAYKGVALDPRDGWAHGTFGYILLFGKKYDEAAAQFGEALKANPNDADLLVLSSGLYAYIGRPEEGIKRVKEAMRLNPYSPNWYFWSLGLCQDVAHDYEGAVETLRRMSPIGEARRILAACLAYLGRIEEARAEAEKYLKDNPSFSVSYHGSTQPFLHDKDRQHAVEGYIKAGLPR